MCAWPCASAAARLIGVLFFLIVVTLVPFAVGPDLALLARIGPAMLWLGALLATLLGLDRLLASDHEDGSLDLLLMGRMPLELALAMKAFAHWLTTGVPLVLAAPALGILLNLDPSSTGAVAHHPARRHPGAHLHRPDRCCAHRRIAAWRASAGSPDIASEHSRPDFRRGGLDRSNGR